MGGGDEGRRPMGEVNEGEEVVKGIGDRGIGRGGS